MTSFTSKFQVGMLVREKTYDKRIAIITNVGPSELGEARLSLSFIGKQPQLYYCISDNYEIIGPVPSLLKELL
jgi:hypothetical protein